MRRDEAATWYRKAFRSLPKSDKNVLPFRCTWVGFLYKLAESLDRQGRHRDEVNLYLEAVEQGRIGVEVDASNVSLLQNLCIALHQVYLCGNLDESRQACKELLDLLAPSDSATPSSARNTIRFF